MRASVRAEDEIKVEVRGRYPLQVSVGCEQSQISSQTLHGAPFSERQHARTVEITAGYNREPRNAY